MSKRRFGRRDEVSAKDLAEMGFCEKRVQLAHLHGERVTPEQQEARTRGLVAHQRYLEDGMASVGDRRCFVATCLFGGSARETHALRRYRDVVMLRSRWGRCFVHCYCSVGPTACWILDRSALLRSFTRRVLADLSRRCEQAVERREIG